MSVFYMLRILNKIIFYYLKKIDKSALFNLQNQTLEKVVLLLIFTSKNTIQCWLFQKVYIHYFATKLTLYTIIYIFNK